jgi:cytochrome c oxidase subunit 1
MALVFTTFFITGSMTYATYKSIPRPGRKLGLGWTAYVVMLIGTAWAAIEILAGNATVLYTFYAPLKADPGFYLGATLLVVGTWLVAFDIIGNVGWFRANNPGQKIPLPAYMCVVTFVMWIIATLGVVAEMLLLIPWAFGWTKGIDVELTRMLFWYFGHPLVYFWIMGAYLIWYLVVPTTYGGKVFSDGLTRLAFILLLLLSTPVGLHHQFLEPGISAGWKWLHTLTTYGIVNSSYSMDVLVHNTMWIVGHFHVTVGGPVALSFIGAAYALVPTLTGRKLFAPKLAVAQTWMWFVGMLLMSFSMHFAGILGAPRRTSDVTYFGAAGAQSWHGEMVFAAVGGTLLFISILMFVVVAVGTRLRNEIPDEAPTFEFAEAEAEALPTPPAFEHIGRWAVLAVVLAAAAYAGPIHDQLTQTHYLAPGMRTW